MKKKKLLTMIGSVCLILVLAALLLPACAPKVVEAPELEAEIKALEGELASEKAEVSKLEKEVAELKKPAEVYEWRCQNIFNPGEPHYIIFDELLFPALEAMSGGRIKVTQYSAGALCPSPEIMEAVGKGMIETAFTVSVYNAGIMPEARLEFSKPGGTTEWFRTQFFGHESYPIMAECWAEHNCYNLPGALGGWYSMISTKPVPTVADLKGMKIRATGLFPNVIEEFGASPTFLALEDLYSGLTLGTVDAVIYSGPGEWLSLKLCEPAKYITAPTLGGTDQAVRFIINLDLWNELPDDLKACLNVWARMITAEAMYNREMANDQCLKVLLEDYGCEIVTWSDEDVARWREVSWKIFDEMVAPENERCARLVQIMKDAVDPEKHPHLQILGK